MSLKLKPEQEIEALRLLQTLPLFTGCPPEAMQAMLPLLDAREVLPAKVIMMDQEIGRSLYLLAKGTVSVWKRVGGIKKQLATLLSPNFFGERSMFEESPASALVKSEDKCLLYVLDRAHFDQVAKQFPVIVDPVKKNMADVRLKRMGPPGPSDEG